MLSAGTEPSCSGLEFGIGLDLAGVIFNVVRIAALVSVPIERIGILFTPRIMRATEVLTASCREINTLRAADALAQIVAQARHKVFSRRSAVLNHIATLPIHKILGAAGPYGISRDHRTQCPEAAY